jgi:fission 1 protein
VECASKPSQDNTFQYAFALGKSDNKRELEYAVSILDGLVKEQYEHQIDCMYGAATALYRLQQYPDARNRCEAILRVYPDHVNTKELHLACIQGEELAQEQKIKRAAIEGTVGVAAIGLALSVAGMMLGKKR